MTNTSVNMPQHPVPPAVQPPNMQQPRPRRGLAVTALIIGILAILTAVVPVLGVVLGIAGIVFAMIALKKRQPKGLAVAGLVLGILATIVSLITTFALLLAGSLFGAVVGNLENQSGEIVFEGGISAQEIEPGDSEPGTASDPFARISWDAFDVADSPASPSGGTEDDPHAIGTRFMVDDKWEIVVNMVDRDAEEHMLALMPDASPAAEGERYVLVNMTVKNLSEEPKELRTLSVHYDIPGKLVSSGRPGTPSPDPALLSEGMQITGNYTGYLAYLIEDVDGSFLRFSEWTTTKPVFVAVE